MQQVGLSEFIRFRYFAMSPVAILYGAVVGISLGLTGGGGALLAVPLLVYGLGIDPHEAVGASLVTVGATALVGFLQRWHLGFVELRTGLLLAVAGMVTAPLGAWLATQVSESLLLVLFTLLMFIIAVRMWRKADVPAERNIVLAPADESGSVCRREPRGELHWNSRCALLLAGAGLGTGLLTGLFGVGGGFMIVPALVLFSGMEIQRAVGTSLMVIALVSASGTASLVATGRTITWSIVGWFVAGSLVGLVVGSLLASYIGGPKLQRVFAVAILSVAVFVTARNITF